jgi:hypothetical protein
MRVADVKKSFRASNGFDPGAQRDLPSCIKDDYWIYAYRQTGTYPAHAHRGGKWLIFVPTQSVDEVWQKISLAVEGGHLGESAKVSTSRPNPIAQNRSKRVICVYTYDSDDAVDVRRIRAVLRALGIRHRIPYKTDKATEDGRYRRSGDKRISKYFE